MGALEVSQFKFSQLTSAKTLKEVSRTLDAAPLQSSDEIQAFYRADVQNARGIDRMSAMKVVLGDCYQTEQHLKTFLLGHPGVGKTTELSHLFGTLSAQWEQLRMSVALDLNPGTLKHYDILLLILIRLIREASKIDASSSGELNQLLDRVKDQLAEKWTKRIGTSAKEWSSNVGLDLSLAKGLASLKQGVVEEQGQKEYEPGFVAELVDLVNEVLVACSRILWKHNQTKWVLVLEDIEKISFRADIIREVFIGLRAALERFECSIIITIPPWLGYGEDSNDLLPINFRKFTLPDVAVYTKEHEVDKLTVDALSAVVLARVESQLMDQGVLEACIISSGGNLRDLFLLLREANLNARVREARTIGLEDVKLSVNGLRYEYRMKLGTTGRQANEIELPAKLKRLVEIYERADSKAEIGDRVLYHLLQNRCVLQFNGEGWMGVHPLVVDLLIDMEIKPIGPGFKGGSRLAHSK